MKRTLVGLAMVLATAFTQAQAPAVPQRAFEVASIKPTPPNPPGTTAGGLCQAAGGRRAM